MTAKQMFEILGYKQSIFLGNGIHRGKDEISCITYTKTEGSTDYAIRFDFETKTFEAQCDYESMGIDVKTLKVIIKQMQELGWTE